jgi:hypothetical protein
MLRFALCAIATLAFSLGFAGAADTKKETKPVAGAFESFSEGKLTISVKGKKGDPAVKKEFKVADDFKVTVTMGEEKKEVVAKEAFKGANDKTQISVTADGDKVTAITVTGAKKAKENK